MDDCSAAAPMSAVLPEWTENLSTIQPAVLLTWDSLLIRKIPLPWALEVGFMIHVTGVLRNSSTKRL